MRIMLAIGLVCLSTTAFAAFPDESGFPVDISGFASWELRGDPLNETLAVDLTPGNQNDFILSGINWNIILSTVSPSWADEPRIAVSDANGDVAILGPFGSATTVTSANFVGGVSVSAVIPKGEIFLEFYETGFNDFSGAPDAFYLTPSTLFFKGIAVPEPACFGLMAAGLGMMYYRRRR